MDDDDEPELDDPHEKMKNLNAWKRMRVRMVGLFFINTLLLHYLKKLL